MTATLPPVLPSPVSSGLNLVLPLRLPKDGEEDNRPAQLARLMAYLEEKRPFTNQALQRLNFVHFARFLPAADGTTLSIITEFDGPLQPYVMDFIIVIGDEFSVILSFMEGWYVQDAQGRPTEHVRDHPDEYWDYVSKHNKVAILGLRPFENLNLYRAYPDSTVLDIIGPPHEPLSDRIALPNRIPVEPEAEIDLSDIQANLVRGVGARHALHLALQVTDADRARAFLGAITSGAGDVPRVSNAKPWGEDERPLYSMTVGFTWEGLSALGVPDEELDKFPIAFKDGPSKWARAASLGDHGLSSPEHWVLGGPGQSVHLVVSLYCDGRNDAKAAFDEQVKALKAALNTYALVVQHEQETWLAPNYREHFGFRDNMAQPRIAGLPPSTKSEAKALGESFGADVQPPANAGEFLLGPAYNSVYGGRSLGRLSAALCTNASFAVVRILKQDVEAFKQVLREGAAACGKSEGWVAARLMGRKYDGTPLSEVLVDGEDLATTNAFDYAPSQAHRDAYQDHEGLVCPVGAHARRLNPRHALVAGEPHSHRVLRRGMLYGPSKGEDRSSEKERGLYGLFVCADIERQFEFLQRHWINGDTAASGIRGTQDPIMGAQDLPGFNGVGLHRIPMIDKQGRKEIKTLRIPRLVTTRGSLYLLMPGLSGLRYLAELGGGGAARAGAGRRPLASFKDAATPLVSVRAWIHKPQPVGARLNRANFNPKDPDFLANPYPYYRVFMKEAPVLPVEYGPYQSLWIFGRELVEEVCPRPGSTAAKSLKFHKPSQPARRVYRDPRDEPETRGLFYMNPPDHTQVRARLNPAVAQHFADSGTFAMNTAATRLKELPHAGGASFDVIKRYSRLVARDTLLNGLGVPLELGDDFSIIAEGMLRHFDPMQPLEVQAEQLKFGRRLAPLLVNRVKCPAHDAAGLAAPPGLWCDMVAGGITPGGPGLKAAKTGLLNYPEPEDRNILATASNFVLAGFLSVDFLVGNALALLLAGDGSGMKAYRAADRAARAAILTEVQRYDAPFQLADRIAVEDTTLDGVQIKEGQMVTVCYGSVNHDPSVFTQWDPDTFDVTRKIAAKDNWVFGHDHHYCIGKDYAPAIAQAILDVLVDGRPNLRLDPNVPGRRMTDAYLRGFESLTLLA